MGQESEAGEVVLTQIQVGSIGEVFRTGSSNIQTNGNGASKDDDNGVLVFFSARDTGLTRLKQQSNEIRRMLDC